MADGYMDDDEAPPADTGTAEATPSEEPAEDTGDEQTFVLPKAIAGGKTFKVGDEMVVEIVAEHEDSFEVKYAPEKKGDEVKVPASMGMGEPEEDY